MNRIVRTLATGLLSSVLLTVLGPRAAEAQGRGNGARQVEVAGAVVLTVEATSRIEQFYRAQAPSGVEALPPGIRKNLARGKPLPPGIAKRSAPPALRSAVDVPTGYELVEVGLDVLLVEVATQVVHDVLMDIIR